jgi:hypothetical protein
MPLARFLRDQGATSAGPIVDHNRSGPISTNAETTAMTVATEKTTNFDIAFKPQSPGLSGKAAFSFKASLAAMTVFRNASGVADWRETGGKRTVFDAAGSRLLPLKTGGA